MGWPNDDVRERYLATANDATAFAMDEEIAVLRDAGDTEAADKLQKERDALFVGHLAN